MAACDPWAWMAEPFLRDEGFNDVRSPAEKDVDLYTDYVHDVATTIDAGVTDRAVAGLHTGCLELFARPGIATIADLRGKTIVVNAKGGTFKGVTVLDLVYALWVSLFAHVGMPPGDANFVEIKGGRTATVDYFVEGKADAVMTLAAQGTLLQANRANPGHVILDTTMDRPWSQYYCCVLRADERWAKANPVALKRATRAILRTIDEIKRDRRVASRVAITKGVFKDTPALTEPVIYDTIKDLSYDWRDYDVAESVRFYALRLADARLIKKTPQQIIDEGTDLAYFNELRKKLRA